MVEEGLRIAQCWAGVDVEGRDSVKSGNNGGFGGASCPGAGFDAGCWR